MTDDYHLTSTDKLTELVKENGISSWIALTEFIKSLPYGRNKNRAELELVLTERKGTCSSKHALLKHLADLNRIPDVKLMLGLYKMNQFNTPKIGTILPDHSLTYMPEAHCYLKMNGKRIDLTSANAAISNIEADILKEIEIEPDQVSVFKVLYHQSFLKEWIKDTQSKLDFNQIWAIREKCIENLSG